MPRSAKKFEMFSTELYVLPVYRLRFAVSRTYDRSAYSSTCGTGRPPPPLNSTSVRGTSFRNRDGILGSGCPPPKRRRERAQLKNRRFSALVMPT